MTMKHSKGVPKCLSNKERFGSRMSWGKNLEAFGKSLQRSDFGEGIGKRMENVKKGLRRGSLPWLVGGLQDRQVGLSVGSEPGTAPCTFRLAGIHANGPAGSSKNPDLSQRRTHP